MAKATKKPPARVRYEESPPTVSFRLSRDTYDLLKQCLEDLGVSAADFIKEAPGLQQLKMPNIGEIEQRAWNEGYNCGKDNYQAWYYCAVCGKRIDVVPNTAAHKAMIGYTKEYGWGHASCHRQ